MAVLANMFSSLVQEVIFFGGDVQTTTIAIAITSSLCCSIVYLVVSLFTTAAGHTQENTRPKSFSMPSRRNSVMAFPVRRRAMQSHRVQVLCRAGSQISSQSVWGGRSTERASNQPCVRCGMKPADKLCHFLLCAPCCHSNTACVCSHHGSNIREAQGLVEGACEHRPTEMDLSYLGLAQCPDRVGYIGAQLTSLNLSNNQLRILPQEIGFLRGLEELFLQYNIFSILPDSIGNLGRLVELDVKNNRLQVLPDSLGNLSKLTTLRLTNNLLESLPSSIGKLTNLDELSAHGNQLQTLPEEICNISRLTVLYVGDNQISHLPDQFGCLVRLVELDLSNNWLKNLPRSFCWCSALSRLWLSHNRLEELPSQFGRLHQLKELYVQNNQIQWFPVSLARLQLYTFNVSDNPLLREWEKERVRDLTHTVSKGPPSLQEFAARVVTGTDVRWEEGDIPLLLQEMLEKKRECSSCERSFFLHYQSEVTFHTVGLSPRIPLYQQICSPYPNSSHCMLLPVK